MIDDPTGPTASYEAWKRNDRDTAAQCERQGFSLLPFIVEAHSGFVGADGRGLLVEIGRRLAAQSGGNEGSIISELSMRIQTDLQGETARATLRRMSGVMESVAAPLTQFQ